MEPIYYILIFVVIALALGLGLGLGLEKKKDEGGGSETVRWVAAGDDYTIYNAGKFPCNRYTGYMTSSTSIDFDFTRKEIIILGTQYAGEMKKGIFTVMHFLMPLRGVLSLHSSANENKEDGSVSIFFGLSGTGKTTLSADPDRYLIGDDEHCWTNDGIFNIEGGCYAKCIDLSPHKEPEFMML